MPLCGPALLSSPKCESSEVRTFRLGRVGVPVRHVRDDACGPPARCLGLAMCFVRMHFFTCFGAPRRTQNLSATWRGQLVSSHVFADSGTLSTNKGTGKCVSTELAVTSALVCKAARLALWQRVIRCESHLSLLSETAHPIREDR